MNEAFYLITRITANAGGIDPAGIISLITGTGGAVVVGWFWLQDRKRQLEEKDKQIAQLVKENQEIQRYVRKFGQSWIELTTEIKIHLESSSQCAKDLEQIIERQHTQTRDEIQSAFPQSTKCSAMPAD